MMLHFAEGVLTLIPAVCESILLALTAINVVPALVRDAEIVHIVISTAVAAGTLGLAIGPALALPMLRFDLIEQLKDR